MNEENPDFVEFIEELLDNHIVRLVSNYMQNDPAVYTHQETLYVQVDGLPNLGVLTELAEACMCELDDISIDSRYEVLIDSECTFDAITYIVITMPIKR